MPLGPLVSVVGLVVVVGDDVVQGFAALKGFSSFLSSLRLIWLKARVQDIVDLLSECLGVSWLRCNGGAFLEI